MTTGTTTLVRPVGRKEMELIEAGGFAAFPPRLPHQPFFYPILNEAYAVQIARDWNTNDEASGFAGYVTRFRVRSGFLARYPIRRAGGALHLEYWIPAAELEEFNRNIVGAIEITAVFTREHDSGRTG
jgi:hypothetical protein